jgi:hypothetical protein
VVLEGGRAFGAGYLRGLDQLGRLIEDEVNRRGLPAALSDYHAGKVIGFGEVGVSTRGITKGLHTQPWDEVTSVSVADGWLSIGWRDRPWSHCIVVSQAKVWNMPLLVRLLEEIRPKEVQNQ